MRLTMARLTKLQKYAALWLISQDHTIENISNELKIPEASLKRLAKNNNQDIKDTPTETEELNKQDKHLEEYNKSRTYRFSDIKKDKKQTPMDMMIRSTMGKKTKNVCIMTKEASELVDESGKNNKNKNKNNK